MERRLLLNGSRDIAFAQKSDLGFAPRRYAVLRSPVFSHWVSRGAATVGIVGAMESIAKEPVTMEKSGPSRALLSVVAVQFIIGIAALARFSQHVRGVEVAGLSGGGAAIGVGLALLVMAFRERYDARRTR